MLAFFCDVYQRKVAQANNIVIFLEVIGDRLLDFVLWMGKTEVVWVLVEKAMDLNSGGALPSLPGI